MDGQLLEHRLLVPVQEVVAPFHEAPERRAGWVGDRAIAEEHRAPLEHGDELTETEHVHARGGELDRQRQSVDAPGDLAGERDSLRVGLESGTCRARTLEEELDSRGFERHYGEPHLARDVERFAARRQDPDLRALREDGRHDPRCLVEHVLARVEDEQNRCVTKPRSHARERVGAASVDGVCKKSHAIVRAARAREVDEPDAVRKLVLERARRLDRESALAHAGWTGERHLAVPTEQRGDLDELVLAADERRRRRREVAAAAAGRGDHGDRRVVREDRLLEAPELRSRLEAQLVGEHAPCLLERLERVRLPPAAVERQHQLAPQPLPERVVCDRRAQRRDQLPVLSERERNLELLLERVHTQRLEPARLGVEPRRAGEALQGRTPPEVERRRNRVRRGPHVAVTQRAARLRQQLLEPDGIHMRVVQRIPIGRARDRRLSQRGAKTRNVVVERIARGGRELLPPQAVDECVDVDDATISEREHCQQGLPLRSAHVRNPSVREHLERAEKPDLQQCVRHGFMLPPSSLPRPGAGIQATAVGRVHRIALSPAAPQRQG